MAGRRAFKSGYLLSKDELLRLKHMAKCFQQFLLERLILALQVQHGYWLSFGGRVRRDCCVLHGHILAAAAIPNPSGIV